MSGRQDKAGVLLRGGVLGLALGLVAVAPHNQAEAEPEQAATSTLQDERYSLDALSREVPPKGPLWCPEVEVVDYKGEIIKFTANAKVFTGFRDRLKEFEKVSRDVGLEFYGRSPSRVVHLGTYSCRRIAAYPEFLSEHALGNAIDIAGFDFGSLPKGGRLPAGVPGVFKNGFEVRVLSHWKAKSGYTAIHAHFLKALAQRLIARKDIFRVLLGPGYPGHENHFHFDNAPFRMVEIYEDGQPLEVLAAAQGSQPRDG